MGTRGTIAVQIHPKLVQQMYVQFDAYLEGLGLALVKHYTFMEQIRALLKNDCIEAIQEDGSVVITARKITKCEYGGLDAFIHFNRLFQDYNYLWKNNKWYLIQRVRTRDGSEKYKTRDLRKLLIKKGLL